MRLVCGSHLCRPGLALAEKISITGVSHCPVLRTRAVGPSLALLSTRCSGVPQIFGWGNSEGPRQGQVTAPSSWSWSLQLTPTFL